MNLQQPSRILICLANANLGEKLDCLQHWLIDTSNSLGFSDRTLLELDLILHEVLTNIQCYAYLGQENRDITLSLTENEEFVLLEIIDQGIPFNPFDQHTYQTATSLSSASIAGRGIHLIKSFTVKQEYQRIEDSNRLRLSFLKRHHTEDLKGNDCRSVYACLG